jgi:hypothetical protein
VEDGFAGPATVDSVENGGAVWGVGCDEAGDGTEGVGWRRWRVRVVGGHDGMRVVMVKYRSEKKLRSWRKSQLMRRDEDKYLNE